MDEFQLASSIAERARAAGGRALFVGGWVRDRLLGRDSKDIDLEVYGIEADSARVARLPHGAPVRVSVIAPVVSPVNAPVASLVISQ